MKNEISSIIAEEKEELEKQDSVYPNQNDEQSKQTYNLSHVYRSKLTSHESQVPDTPLFGRQKVVDCKEASVRLNRFFNNQMWVLEYLATEERKKLQKLLTFREEQNISRDGYLESLGSACQSQSHSQDYESELVSYLLQLITTFERDSQTNPDAGKIFAKELHAAL